MSELAAKQTELVKQVDEVVDSSKRAEDRMRFLGRILSVRRSETKSNKSAPKAKRKHTSTHAADHAA